jgi:hypothetical protein
MHEWSWCVLVPCALAAGSFLCLREPPPRAEAAAAQPPMVPALHSAARNPVFLMCAECHPRRRPRHYRVDTTPSIGAATTLSPPTSTSVSVYRYLPVKICLYMVGQLMASVMPFYVEYVVEAPLDRLAFWLGAYARAAAPTTA